MVAQLSIGQIQQCYPDLVNPTLADRVLGDIYCQHIYLLIFRILQKLLLLLQFPTRVDSAMTPRATINQRDNFAKQTRGIERKQ